MFLLNGKTTDSLLNEAYQLSNIPNERELDVLLSSGEQISMSKLSILLNNLGYKAVSLTGWQAGIYTNNTNQNALIECIDTSRIYKELEKRNIVIVAGFQGYNDNLDITTLGRGGSDTTAVALASALNATHCYIFSDVDGVYTTDPNKYSDAKKLESLSYSEMLDISNEGAKVLHNRCVEIGEKFNIPIITKCTFNNKSGSVITNKIEEGTVKSIVKNDDLILVNLKYENYSIKLLNQVYDLFISQNIIPICFANNSTAIFDVNFIVRTDVLNKLQRLFNNDLKMFTISFKNITKIAIIGYGITNDSIVLGKIFDIIKKFNIDVYDICVSTSKVCITFKEKVSDSLLELIHKELLED